MTGFPICLSLFNALFAGRHEIPPDMARSIHRRAADDDEMGVVDRRDGWGIARLEHQQPSRLELVAGNIDDTFDNIDRALLVARIERQRRAGLQMHIAEYRLVYGRHRR